MCVIIDNDVRDQVFGDAASPAGAYLFEWLTNRGGKLVVGGEVRRELSGAQSSASWLRQALRVGQAVGVDDAAVDAESEALRRQQVCRSNDTHVLALARLSNARLLFSNDRKLHEDFRNRNLVARPRGSVYTTLESKEVTNVHRRLLSRPDRCPMPEA